ncbi:MAG TPA: MogA/MoaB family molybdenum cofactor biosynthesis protein [Thermoplasmata archaeon]|jgi:molybdenum cofactor biosynthesis protein B|nr:MogA/MoaB family molybdenum cofactor biosynthesis protein [Thermoplasmata archaeon]
MPEPSKAVREHREHAPPSVRVAVITVSDTKDEATDESGRILRNGIEAAGFRLAHYAIVRDETNEIRTAIEASLRIGTDAVITNGGTGVARRDVTIEALAPLFEKALDGFGDLFRLLSFQKVGSASMLSRAAAGVYKGAAIFCLPGSPDGVRLAWEDLIRPELPHLVGLLRK